MADTPNNISAPPALNFPTFMSCKMPRDFVDADVDVVISGVGSLEYYGEPSVNQQISGLGRIQGLGDK